MRRRATQAGLWVWALATLLLAVSSGPEAGAEETARELEALRQAIEERRSRVEAYEREERGLFEAIEAVDTAIRALAADAERAARAAHEAQEALRALEAESADLAERLARTQHALGRRAAALYKAGELGPVRLVFAEGSLRDRLGRIHMLQRLLEHDERLLARLREEQTALDRARADARAAAERRDAARARLAERSRALEVERGTRRELLISVRRDRARERAALNELEAAARALEETLARLREAPERPGPPPAQGFALRRGGLELPVPGPLLRRFGRVIDGEFRTETFRKGVDFAVEVGESVYAVADGEVRFADWFRGYGKLVILDHGDDYFSVSGHLDEIEVSVGNRLQAGDRIGTAGETGSLGGPRLYFEIRRGGEALDPAEWLRLLPER
jgi:murein hydrolase activator